MAFHRSSGPIDPAKGQVAYALGGVLALTVLPAGHEPGVYVLSTTQYLITAAASGSLALSLGWDQPGAGAATLSIGNVNVNATGLLSNTQRVFASTGVAAAIATLTPASIVGSPVAYITSSVVKVADLPTS